MQSRALPSSTARDILLVLLTAAAGCVDAVSYLGLGQVLTAAMTGNTVLLGLAIGQGNIAAAIRSGVALAGFFFGAVLGAAIVERGPKNAMWPGAVTAAMALELAGLAALAFGWHVAGNLSGDGAVYRNALIAGAGLAMGVQSVAVHRLGVAGVTTTYVTGTLASSAMRLVVWLRPSREAGSPPVGPDPSRSGRPAYLTAVWLSYGAGAVAAGAVGLWWPVAPISSAAAGSLRWPTVALLLPIAIVATVVTTAAIRYRGNHVAGP